MEENSESNASKQHKPQEGDVEIATGAFIIRDDKLFLATGSKFHDEWVVPGGHLNFRENAKQCIEREVMEEINVKINAIEMFSVTEATHRVVKGRARHFIFLNWKCEVVTGEPKLDGVEFTKMTWMPIEQALIDPKVTGSVKASIKAWNEKKIIVQYNGR